MNGDLAPIYSKYSDEYEHNFENGKIQFKNSTSNHAIKAFLLESVVCKHNLSDEECIKIMMSKLKTTNFYEIKSKKEVEEFIEFLNDNSNLSEILDWEDDDESDEFIDGSFIDIV